MNHFKFKYSGRNPSATEKEKSQRAVPYTDVVLIMSAEVGRVVGETAS